MKIIIKENLQRGYFEIDVPLYLRDGDEFAIDFDKSTKQIKFVEVALWEAEVMKKDLEKYINTLTKATEQN